jgi:hypothetical protein
VTDDRTTLMRRQQLGYKMKGDKLMIAKPLQTLQHEVSGSIDMLRESGVGMATPLSLHYAEELLHAPHGFCILSTCALGGKRAG